MLGSSRVDHVLQRVERLAHQRLRVRHVVIDVFEHAILLLHFDAYIDGELLQDANFVCETSCQGVVLTFHHTLTLLGVQAIVCTARWPTVRTACHLNARSRSSCTDGARSSSAVGGREER